MREGTETETETEKEKGLREERNTPQAKEPVTISS
jgi:hypothetical protein